MLNLLERSLFGPGLLARTYIEQRLGASIVVWPVACARRTRANAALAALAQGYIHQRFNVPAGQWPGAAQSSLPARPRVPYGTAASPTTPCTCSMPTWPTAWCCNRTASMR